jgi:hypothetical protein
MHAATSGFTSNVRGMWRVWIDGIAEFPPPPYPCKEGVDPGLMDYLGYVFETCKKINHNVHDSG